MLAWSSPLHTMMYQLQTQWGLVVGPAASAVEKWVNSTSAWKAERSAWKPIKWRGFDAHEQIGLHQQITTPMPAKPICTGANRFLLQKNEVSSERHVLTSGRSLNLSPTVEILRFRRSWWSDIPRNGVYLNLIRASTGHVNNWTTNEHLWVNLSHKKSQSPLPSSTTLWEHELEPQKGGMLNKPPKWND